jgi:hypothetical protein
MDVISILGSIASIAAAIVSVYSAIKANEIKNTIIGRLHLNKITEIKSMAKASLLQINKICLPESKLRGVNTAEIIASLLSMQSSINENKDILKRHEFENFESITSSLKSDIKELKYEKNKSDISKIGEKLYDNVDFIVSELSRISRSKVEK